MKSVTMLKEVSRYDDNYDSAMLEVPSCCRIQFSWLLLLMVKPPMSSSCMGILSGRSLIPDSAVGVAVGVASVAVRVALAVWVVVEVPQGEWRISDPPQDDNWIYLQQYICTSWSDQWFKFLSPTWVQDRKHHLAQFY